MLLLAAGVIKSVPRINQTVWESFIFFFFSFHVTVYDWVGFFGDKPRFHGTLFIVSDLKPPASFLTFKGSHYNPLFKQIKKQGKRALVLNLNL